MADMKRIKGRIAETIYPNGQGAITAEAHQALLLEMVDEINSKKQDTIEGGAPFSEQGNYPDLSAGFAENLVGRGESVPAEFTFRASGGKSIKDGAARIKRIKGNSVVWNQKVKGELRVQDGTMSQSGDRYTITPTGEYAGIQTEITDLIQGHKYICLCSKVGGSKPLYLNWGGYDSLANAIFEVTNVNKVNCTLYAINENETFTLTRPIICDLTQMFQAGNEPTTIEEYEARKPIVADEYAYNEGEVIHMNVDSIKSVGDNAWDEEWELGAIDNNMGTITPSYSHIRSKNYIKVISGETYYMLGNFIVIYYDENYNQVDWWSVGGSRELTIPSNVQYLKLYANGITYNHDIMITLVHSGWKQDTDAGYQPYWQDTLPLPIISKYFPDGMKSAGSAHDEILFNKASGKWEIVRIGSVDLGSFDYNLDSRFDNAQFYCDTSLLINNNIRCGRYVTIEGGWDTNKDKTITRTSGGQILIVDSAYTDAASFKAAMQGVILYYELAEPVIREIDEPIGTDYRVADFGTEQAISSIPSAPFSADIIYQFNAVDMIREHELEITQLQAMIATMQAQLASLVSK